jgi:DNA-binding response OmpR family regulator
LLTHATSKPQVHVVDDEVLLAEFVTRALRRSYQVTMNVDPERALEDLLAATVVDVVISDVMMSPFTGLRLYEVAVAARPHLSGRFIFMTGGATTEAGKRFLEALPRERLLLKPFSPGELEEAVRGVMSSQAALAAP